MDPRERLRSGQQAAREHRYEEALEHYVWFHEHALEHDPAYYGVRLSFALSSWAELGKAYPPALDSLRDIRDRKTDLILAGAGNRDLFNDVEAINQYLDDEEATYYLFVELHKKYPELARTCAGIAMPALIKKKDYRLARIFIQKPEEMIRRWSAGLKEDIAALAEKPPTRAPVKETYIRIYIDHVREILEVLIGVGENEEAANLRQLAIETFEAPDVREPVEIALAEISQP